MKKIFTMMSFLLLVGACADEIGDSCKYDVDCSQNMDRNCDRSQPGGYCLIIGCASDECPGEAVCVNFTTECPSGTKEEDCRRIEPNRGRTYCLKHCKKNKDCRSKYDCIDPEELSAAIIDLDTNKSKICVPKANE